jgi:tetratricopeptide (TPR) repeat protein
LEPDSPLLAETFFGIGVTARNRGEYHSARDFLAEALKIQKQLELSHETCLTLIELGNVYRLLHDPLSATGCYERCLAIVSPMEEDKSLVGRIHLLLGHAHLNQNNVAEAADCYEQGSCHMLGRSLDLNILTLCIHTSTDFYFPFMSMIQR